MLKAGLLPKISHYELHMRDRLCDVVRGTLFASMELLRGWKRVNSSLEPTVPRGIREGLFSEALRECNRKQSTHPHSMQTTSEWVEGAWGTPRSQISPHNPTSPKRCNTSHGRRERQGDRVQCPARARCYRHDCDRTIDYDILLCPSVEAPRPFKSQNNEPHCVSVAK